MIARGWVAFNSFLGSAYSHRLPFPVQAVEIPNRIESVCLHGIELCVLTKSAESHLNRMQVGWAKALLGIRSCMEGTWLCLMAECGWVCRLGTRMWDRAVMVKARLTLLPATHPASLTIKAASCSETTTWVSTVSAWQKSSIHPNPIPDIREVCSSDEAVAASSCKATRARLLYNYRRHHVLPALRLYDNNAFIASCRRNVWPYLTFQPDLDEFPPLLFNPEWSMETWQLYRAWAVVKVMGRIPLQVFEVGELPRFLEPCPFCQDAVADVHHFLMICTSMRDLFYQWVNVARIPLSQLDWAALQPRLFAGRLAPGYDDVAHGHARINFVGSVFKRVAVAVKKTNVPWHSY